MRASVEPIAAFRVGLKIPLALRRALGAVLAATAGYYLLAFVAVALLRVGYPFELEWMESLTVDSSRRILEGRELYTAPTIDFISPIYNPLYFWLSAGLMKLVGVGFLAPRLVSFAAALGSIGLIFALVRRETSSSFAGLLAAGLFAATYRATGAWLDVARVDSLFLFFTLLAAYLARRYPGARGAALCALALVLAYAVKQSALLMLACLGGFYLLTDRKAGAVFGLVALATGVPFFLYNNLATAGWFSFYAVEVVGQHDLLPDRHRYVLEDVVRLALMGVAAGMFLLRRGGTSRSGRLFYAALLAGMLGMSYLGRINSGGYDNVLLPAAAALAIVAALAVESAPRGAAGRQALLAALLCAIQLAALFYDPVQQVPTEADRAAGEHLLRTIRSFSGEVYIPSHTTYAAQAGKPTYAHWTAVAGLEGIMYTNRAALRGSSTEARRMLVRPEVERAIASRRFEAIILDEPRERRAVYWTDHLAGYYKLQGVVFPPEQGKVFYPRTGSRTRPQYVYVPTN